MNEKTFEEMLFEASMKLLAKDIKDGKKLTYKTKYDEIQDFYVLPEAIPKFFERMGKIIGVPQNIDAPYGFWVKHNLYKDEYWIEIPENDPFN